MNPHGSFIWYELMTGNPDGARAFYEPLVGWSIDASPPPGPMDYRTIAYGSDHVGGMLTLTKEMTDGGGRPGWLGYFGVDDVDAAHAAIVAAGGESHLEPFDVPGVGRLAMLSDPQGVPFYIMRGAVDMDSTAYGRMAMGHVSWNELMTSDDAAALAFYADQFNVKKVGAMPMGELGDYSFIAHGDSDEAIGAVMKAQPGTPNGWGFYFRVPDIDAAKAQIEATGGTIYSGPMEVPGGEWVINAGDPEGVAFGLVAPARSAG